MARCRGERIPGNRGCGRDNLMGCHGRFAVDPWQEETWERGVPAMNLRAICGRGQRLPWMAADCREESGARLP
jgi:hypothetical protein